MKPRAQLNPDLETFLEQVRGVLKRGEGVLDRLIDARIALDSPFTGSEVTDSTLQEAADDIHHYEKDLGRLLAAVEDEVYQLAMNAPNKVGGYMRSSRRITAQPYEDPTSPRMRRLDLYYRSIDLVEQSTSVDEILKLGVDMGVAGAKENHPGWELSIEAYQELVQEATEDLQDVFGPSFGRLNRWLAEGDMDIKTNIFTHGEQHAFQRFMSKATPPHREEGSRRTAAPKTIYEIWFQYPGQEPEVVDQFDTPEEAKAMLKEYQLGSRPDQGSYVMRKRTVKPIPSGIMSQLSEKLMALEKMYADNPPYRPSNRPIEEYIGYAWDFLNTDDPDNLDQAKFYIDQVETMVKGVLRMNEYYREKNKKGHHTAAPKRPRTPRQRKPEWIEHTVEVEIPIEKAAKALGVDLDVTFDDYDVGPKPEDMSDEEYDEAAQQAQWDDEAKEYNNRISHIERVFEGVRNVPCEYLGENGAGEQVQVQARASIKSATEKDGVLTVVVENPEQLWNAVVSGYGLTAPDWPIDDPMPETEIARVLPSAVRHYYEVYEDGLPRYDG